MILTPGLPFEIRTVNVQLASYSIHGPTKRLLMWRHTVVKEACVSFRPEFTSKSLKLPVVSAGVVQWQYWSLPSFGPRFDSHPSHGDPEDLLREKRHRRRF